MTRHERIASAAKRPTNVSLSAELIDEARRLEINVSQACEQGLKAEVAKTRKERWREENREVIEYWNRWVAENGLPLEEYRQF